MIFLFLLLPIFLFGINLEEMTLEEKIGQLFILPACPLGGEKHFEDLSCIFEKYAIGGIILKASDYSTQMQFLKKLHEKSKYPLLVTADAEWGLGMRMTDGLSFPRNLTLGAIQDDALLYQLGKGIGKECKSAGIHLNFAPVVDVNSNPLNPIIHMRSFGENPELVAKKAVLIMKGMQEEGVMATAKHFPGHGDTKVDSHVDLPVIDQSFENLYRTHLFPFRKMIEEGVSCIMSGHLRVPALEETPIPSSLSKNTIQHFLRERLGFDGLVISDALNMKALSLYYSPGEIAKLCFQSGHDLLLYGDHIAPNIERILTVDFPEAFSALKEGIINGELSETELDEKVQRILKAKESVPSATPSNIQEGKDLKQLLFEKAATLVKNEDVLPLSFMENTLFFTLHVAKPFLPPLDGFEALDKVVFFLKGFNYALPNYGMDEQIFPFLQEAKKKCKTCLVLMGTPYALAFLQADAILVLYEEVEKELAIDILYGKKKPSGKLPVTAGKFPAGHGESF